MQILAISFPFPLLYPRFNSLPLLPLSSPFASFSRNVTTCSLHNAYSPLSYWDAVGRDHFEKGGRMQVRERLDAFSRGGRSFKELLLRHTSSHSRGWRCINVSRGITSPDVSISGSQLFISRALHRLDAFCSFFRSYRSASFRRSR